MLESRRRLAVATAVFAGATIVFAPPTVLVLVVAADVVASVAGIHGTLDGVSAVVVGLPSVPAAAVVVTEATAVQLSGFARLHRGTRRQCVVRHLVLGSVVLAAFVATVGTGLRSAAAATDPATRALAVLLGLVVLWAGRRTARALAAGYATEIRRRPRPPPQRRRGQQ